MTKDFDDNDSNDRGDDFDDERCRLDEEDYANDDDDDDDDEEEEEKEEEEEEQEEEKEVEEVYLEEEEEENSVEHKQVTYGDGVTDMLMKIHLCKPFNENDIGDDVLDLQFWSTQSCAP
ncbi:hypothetical protein PoB_002066300 [Plakobranchus ocellatus]|uniref:Uncharacterized protein n=1 Tax=Plakobranchus ocellatus TaxID=259542 RepID=A0AAV3ZH84_9GAST|nr:hypothetical protein PoB_002066300 [Plakobranchus ocellatus]